MDEQNIPLTREMVEATAAKWDAIDRVAALAMLHTIVFLALIIHLAWKQLERTAPWVLYFLEVCLGVLVVGSIVGFFIHRHQMYQEASRTYSCVFALGTVLTDLMFGGASLLNSIIVLFPLILVRKRRLS